MEDIKKYIQWILISVLFILLIQQRECHKCPDVNSTITIHDTIPGDVVVKDSIINQTYPIYTIVPRIDTFFKLDSQKCWQLAMNFYSKRIYQDTLKNDSSALIVLKDTVYQNKLHERMLFFKNNRPTLINTTIIPNKNKLYIGPTIGRNLKEITIGGSIMYITKKDHAYSYTYDILNKDHYVSIYFKIKFKK